MMACSANAATMPLTLPIMQPKRIAPGHPPRAPLDARRAGIMMDSHGRVIRDLRLSLTDRCNFRCVYCMDSSVRFKPAEALLTAEECIRLARIAASLGVRKLRLTGGEPTLRSDLLDIIRGVRASTDLELAMISNGSWDAASLPRQWKHAGLDRITISIDSADERGFAGITRSSSSAADVVRAIRSCIDAGLTPVKLNAVLLRGVNEDQALPLVELARRLGVEMRFIEYMPLDSAHAWEPRRFVPASETRAAIESRYPLMPIEANDPSSTSRNFRFADGSAGTIGFIAPVSSPFCGACSRLRITADGAVRPCLFSTREWSLMPLLRSGAEDEELRSFLIDATWTKQAGHGIASPGFVQPHRPMSAIGG